MAFKYEKSHAGEHSLTRTQVERLLKSIDDLHILGAVKIALATGMRREDIVCIRQADVDLDNRAITFMEEKKDKTRTVYVSQDVASTLGQIIRVNGRSTYLFPARRNKRGDAHLCGKTLYVRFNEYLTALGIDERPFHSLRGTCAKFAKAAGWTDEQVAALLGDKVETIQRHYTVASMDEVRELSEKQAVI